MIEYEDKYEHEWKRTKKHQSALTIAVKLGTERKQNKVEMVVQYVQCAEYDCGHVKRVTTRCVNKGHKMGNFC